MNKLNLLVTASWLCMLAPPISAQESTDEGSDQLEEVVVTGSRIPRQDYESNSPLTTIGGTRFTNSGSTNIIQELQRLPAFTANRSTTSGTADGFTGSFLDLRGLGKQRTLTLVDGRRWLNSISDGGVDVSTIPPELVERVEIVTGGASATYGSDAIAGVVNIILKKDFEGAVFSAKTGFTDRDGHTNSRIALTVGDGFASGQGSAYFHMSYDTLSQIDGSDRNFLSPSRTNVNGELVPFYSTTTNTGAVFFEGQSAPAFFDASGNLFDSNGEFNRLSGNQLFDPSLNSVVQEGAEKYTIFAGVQYEIRPGLRLYGDAFYVREETEASLSPDPVFLGDFTGISVDNPFLAPETQAYLQTLDTDSDGIVFLDWRRRFNELGTRDASNDRDSFRFMVGFEYDLNDTWSWDTSAVYSVSNFSIIYANNVHFDRLVQALDVINGPNGPECNPVSTFSTRSCVPLNIFGPNSITPEMADFIRSNVGTTGNNTDTTITSVFTGELFDLPAGVVGASVGAEFRRSEGSEAPSDTYIDGQWRWGNAFPIFASLDQTEVFGEVLIPLLSDAPFANYLGLELGARYTNFDPGTDAWTYKVLAEWSPIEKIRFRGGIQRATRAPNLFEVGANYGFTNTLEFFNGGAGDPCFTGVPLTGDLRTSCVANGVPAAIADAGAAAPSFHNFFHTFDGNPNLEPEIADTITLGVVFSDLFTENLNVTIDYYDIDLQDGITFLGERIIFNRCYASGTGGTDPFCDEIQRDPTTGLIDTFNDGPQNAAANKFSGIDVSFNYTRDAAAWLGDSGMMTINVLATHVLEQSLQAFTDDPSSKIDCVGLYGANCSFGFYGGLFKPENQMDATLTFENSVYGASLYWTFVGSLRDDATKFDPGSLSNIAVTESSRTSYFDIAVWWNVTDSVYIHAGVENLLDEEPPIVGLDRAGGNNSLFKLYDQIGRRFYLGTSMKF